MSSIVAKNSADDEVGEADAFKTIVVAIVVAIVKLQLSASDIVMCSWWKGCLVAILIIFPRFIIISHIYCDSMMWVLIFVITLSNGQRINRIRGNQERHRIISKGSSLIDGPIITLERQHRHRNMSIVRVGNIFSGILILLNGGIY